MKRSLRIVYFKNANHIKEDVKLVSGDWVGYPCTLEERGLRSLAVARTKPPAPWWKDCLEIRVVLIQNSLDIRLVLALERSFRILRRRR